MEFFKNKKIIVALILIICVIICVGESIKEDGVIRRAICKVDEKMNPKEESKYKNFYDEAIDVLFKKDNVKIFVCGDDIEFKNGVTVEKVDLITDDCIKSDDSLNVIVYNNLSASNSISEEELKTIEKALCNENFMFFYAGDTEFDKFIEHGIYTENTKQDNNYCVVSEFVDGYRHATSGIYTEHDDEVLSEGESKYSGLDDCIILEMITLFRSMN